MKSKVIAVVAVMSIGLTGCSAFSGADGNTAQPDGGRHPETVWPHTVILPDGRHVLCVFEKQGYGGGLSCDWSNAK